MKYGKGSYDHQNMTRPKRNETIYVLKYEECMEVIQSMRFGNESDLFGKERDDSFKGSIGNIYQSFGGVDIYESLEEKGANLLICSIPILCDTAAEWSAHAF